MTKRVPEVRPLSRREIEATAMRVSRKLAPEAWPFRGPFPVLKFFERLYQFDRRLDPCADHLEPNVLGEMRPDGLILLSKATYEDVAAHVPRARFTAAHECGHAILHFRQIRVRLTEGKMNLHRRSALPAYKDPEWQADSFAAALLMPESVVRKIAKEKPSDLELEIARFFCVSRAAAHIRLEKLKLN